MQISGVNNEYYTGNKFTEKANKSKDLFKVSNDRHNKDKTDYFKEICERYPGASFYVANNKDKDGTKYEYSGISDTHNFGNPGVRSYSISEEILEKMNDPEYKRRFYGVLDFMESDSEYERHVSHLDEKYKYMIIEDSHGKTEDQFHIAISGTSEPWEYIQSANEEKGGGSIVTHEAIMKKISYFAEERYNKLVEDLFDKQDKKKEHE